MIEEVTEEQFHRKMKEKASVAVFFHSPFCGTCSLARTMIETARRSLEGDSHVIACDLNIIPDLAQSLNITSVPALVFFYEGVPIHRLFAFRSHDELHYLLSRFALNKSLDSH